MKTNSSSTALTFSRPTARVVILTRNILYAVHKPNASEYTSLNSSVYVFVNIIVNSSSVATCPFGVYYCHDKTTVWRESKKELHKWLFSNWLSEHSPCFQLVRQTVSPALKNVQVKHSSQAKLICLVLFTVHAVSKQLYRKSWWSHWA